MLNPGGEVNSGGDTGPGPVGKKSTPLIPIPYSTLPHEPGPKNMNTPSRPIRTSPPSTLFAAALGLLAFLLIPHPVHAEPGKVNRDAFKDITFSPEIITMAAEQKLAFTGNNRLQNGPQRQAYGIYFNALVTAINPAVKTPAGQPVADILLAQIRNLIAPGHEPNAGGGLNGWTHSAIAQAFLLVKSTPEVWSRLNADEQNRMDWIMKALAIAGHFGYDDGNDYKTSLHADDNSYKKWNPNHRLYLFVVLAASQYFGPKELNEIFTSFDYDEYLKKFDELGFSNIKAVWTCYDWKPLFENGGPYISPKANKEMGTGTGVRHPFTYEKLPLENLVEIFALAQEYNYSDTVTNGVEGKSWILNNGSSPFLGQTGMMREFNSHDAGGIRSSLSYCEENFSPYTIMYVTLDVLGLLPRDSQRLREIGKRIYVGNEDFLYKKETGFHSFQHGKGADSVKKESASWLPFPISLEIWNKCLKPRLESAGR